MMEGILHILQYAGWYYLTAINLITFIVYAIDKRKAKKNRWRISEQSLICLAVLGGSVGALLGMHVFHHKTRKRKFAWGIPVIFLIQAAAALGIFLNIPNI